MSLQSKALGYFSGINWYKAAAKALIVIGLVGYVHVYDLNKCKLDQANAVAAAEHIKYVDVVREVKVRVPEVREVEKKTIEYRNVVKAIGDKLDEANKSPTAGSCNLSPEQLQYFQELAKATQH